MNILLILKDVSMASEVQYIPCIAGGCTGLTPKGRLHCDHHLKIFKPKYQKYKKITNRIQKYLDDPSLVKDLSVKDQRMVATELHIAAHLRKEFQVEAIKHNKRDPGHIQIIDRMLEMSKEIFQRLDDSPFEIDTDADDSDVVLADTTQENVEMTSSPQNEDDFDMMVARGIRENIQAMSTNLTTILEAIKEIEKTTKWKIDAASPEVLVLSHLSIIASALKSLSRYRNYDIIIQIVVDIRDWLKIKQDPSVRFVWSEYLAVALGKNDIPNPLTLINQENKQLILRVASSILAGIRLIGPSFVCNLSYGNDVVIELDRNSVIKRTGSIIYSKTSIAGISNSMCLSAF